MPISKKRAYDGHATRERILDSAFDLFQRCGYHATNMQTLQEAAGVPAGSMYHFFGSKKSLCLAVIAERVSPAVIATWVDPLRTAKDPIKAITEIFTSVSDGIDEARRVTGCPVTNLAVELAGRDKDFSAALRQTYSIWETALRDRLHGSDSQALRTHAPQLATLIVATFAGALSLARAEQRSDPLRRCAEEISLLLLAAS